MTIWYSPSKSKLAVLGHVDAVDGLEDDPTAVRGVDAICNGEGREVLGVGARDVVCGAIDR